MTAVLNNLMHTFLCINWLMHTFHFVSTGARACSCFASEYSEWAAARVSTASEYEYVLAASRDVPLLWEANRDCTVLLAALSLRRVFENLPRIRLVLGHMTALKCLENTAQIHYAVSLVHSEDAITLHSSV